jgi:hypothetical protein
MRTMMKLCTAGLSARPITGFSVLFGIALMLVPVPAAAQGTPEQRAACEGDAMRLCGQFRDIQQITACMQQNRRYLSPRCRAEFGKRKGGR